MEYALYMMGFKIMEQMKTGGYALGTFLDIDRAFSATLYQTICMEAVKHGVPSMMVGWIRGMLCHRALVANLKTGYILTNLF